VVDADADLRPGDHGIPFVENVEESVHRRRAVVAESQDLDAREPRRTGVRHRRLPRRGILVQRRQQIVVDVGRARAHVRPQLLDEAAERALRR
jgi:hypothetical protein